MSYYMIIEHIRKRTEKRLRGVWYEQREKTAAIFFNNSADSASGGSSVRVDEYWNMEV